MKTLSFIAVSIFMTTSIISCADSDHRYIDLETGKRINVVKDSANGYMVNADTKEPVTIYVDTKSKDTIYGKTGKVINNHVIKTEEGKYKYVSNDNMKANDDDSYKIKDGDYKKPNAELTSKIINTCAARGLVVISAGVHGNVIRILSPLVIEEALLNKGLDILENAIKENA